MDIPVKWHKLYQTNLFYPYEQFTFICFTYNKIIISQSPLGQDFELSKYCPFSSQAYLVHNLARLSI